MKYEIERLGDKVKFTITIETFMSVTRPLAGVRVEEKDKEYASTEYIGEVGFENEIYYEVRFEDLQRKMFVSKSTNKLLKP